MKQAAFLAFCQSWMKRDLVMAQRSGLSKDLEAHAKRMFFRQGLCNSNQFTSIFTDQYQRCAYITDPSRSLLYLAVKALSDKFLKQKEYLIPISDRELALNLLKNNNSLIKNNFICTLENVSLGDQDVLCIHAKLQVADSSSAEHTLINLLKFIATWGALATQDQLLDILLQLNHHEVLLVQNEQDSTLVNDNMQVSIVDILKLLNQAPRIANLKSNEANSYAFYCVFIEKFIQGFYDFMQAHEDEISIKQQFLNQQALKRLYLKLLIVQDGESDYQTCMTSLELSFDEIANMLSITHKYSKEDLFATIKSFMHDNLALPAENMPTTVSMAGSCMQVLHRKILSSLKYLSAQNNNDVKAFVMSDIYYEVCRALGLEQNFTQNMLVTFNGTQPSGMQNYDESIVDLMLLNFHANVNRCKAGFVGHDVEAIIAKQFKLRAQNNVCKQLVVIFDLTMTDLTDKNVRRVLNSFQEQIANGSLAIILTTSLNKYCQIGFDRFPSGISAEFFAGKYFPNFAKNELAGFEANNAIPQTVTHYLRHVGNSITSYYRMVHAFSRELHDKIIPQSLYDSKLPMHIDNPYTQDGYNKPWGFMVVRFADKITEEYKPKVEKFLDSIGITFRDGFGFNKSTYNSIGNNREILRISIGPTASLEQYEKLVKFLEDENELLYRKIQNKRMKM